MPKRRFAGRWAAQDATMRAGEVHDRGFSPRFSLWNRQLQATRRPFHYRVRVDMEGIPPHVWNRTTAQLVLGSSAWVERLGTLSASRADMGSFEAFAWTDDPSLLPKEKLILVEEPDEAMEVELADGLVLPADVLVPLEKNMLEYRVTIHLVNSENTTQGSGPSSGDEDDDEDGFDFPEADPDGPGGARNTRRRFHFSRGEVDGSRQRGRRMSRHGDAAGHRRFVIDLPTSVEAWPTRRRVALAGKEAVGVDGVVAHDAEPRQARC
uniref:DUF4283 domain-containing protein n=1 Tax=Aegilops tauschii subsp. strangulata TaxID=200361 RepID=A0A453D068_AEGTS